MMNSTSNLCDEEIAYQLQLEALSECSQQGPVPKRQATSSQQASSSRYRLESSAIGNGGIRDSESLVLPNVADDEEDIMLALSKRIRDSDVGRGGMGIGCSPATGSSARGKAFLPMFDVNNNEDIVYALGKMIRDADPNEGRMQNGPGGHAAGSSAGRQLVFEVECGICTELRPHTSFVSTLKCNHEYCSDCCKRYAELKIMGGSTQVECPHQDCPQIFDFDQCIFLLTPQTFENLSTRQAEATILQSHKLYCPFKDCSALMEKSDGNIGSGNHEQMFVECCACNRGFCLQCNVPWHANQTCSEYRANLKNVKSSGDDKLRDLAKKEKWQTCTECQRVIELKEGCFHMTCLCGNEFCYTCGAKWKNKHATCKCKLWDERNIIRARQRRAIRFII